MTSTPRGLDSDIFFMRCGNTTTNNNSDHDDAVLLNHSSSSGNNNNNHSCSSSGNSNHDCCMLGQAFHMWAKLSENLGYTVEAAAIRRMAIDVSNASVVLSTKSSRANQMSRDVCRKSMSPQVMEQLTPLLFGGCCSEIYQRLMSILHGLRSKKNRNGSPNDDGDLFHLTHIISFLDSDREFSEVLLAHQTIEDAYKALNIFIPRLRQMHSAERLGEVLHNNYGKMLGSGGVPSLETPHYHNHPCGPCAFQYIMVPR